MPTVERIVYGDGIVGTIGAEAERLGAQRVMLLTARSLAGGALARTIADQLSARYRGTFAAAFEHVPLERAAEAVAAARRLDADLIIALGGGSVIDAAKAARLCIAAGLTSAEHLGEFMQKPGPLINGMIPQLTIPVTLSGAEYTRSFSATDFAIPVKRSYTNSAVTSRVILYDPRATLETPMALWSASGVMALDHAIEVFCASPPHPVGDVLKLAAARELLTNLPHTVTAPSDLVARLRCQVAGWMADHSPLRAQPLIPTPAALPSHALAYELGALCRMPYGVVACVTLAASMRWTAARKSATAARQAEMARALGIATQEVADADAAAWFADEIERLIVTLRLPARLGDAGVGRDAIAEIARRFAERGASLIGDGPASAADVTSLLESAC